MVDLQKMIMAHGVVSICGLSLLLLFFVSSGSGSTTYESHTETHQVTVFYQESYCYSCLCGYVCTGWGCYRRCRYTTSCKQCCVVRKSRTETRTRCQAHWTGPNCNIPYCTQKCSAGQTCIPGNRCQCVTAAQTKCKAEGCTTPKLSCYPGTCAGSGSSCTCPAQFNGTNCLTILQTPAISECQVKLFSGNPEREVASANCAVEGHEPEVTWVGSDSFYRIEPSYRTTYLYPYDPIPPAETNHVKDAKFGITETKASVTVTPSSSSPITLDVTPVCKGTRTIEPTEYVDCSRRSIPWSEFGVTSLTDNSTLEVTVSSKLGGYKILHDGDQREVITGLESTQRKVRFKVDSKAPIHCRQTRSCDDPAISVSLDAVQNPVVEFEFTNWFDLESGIKLYEFEVYQLLKSPSGDILVRIQKATEKRTIDGNTNRTQYTFPAPGVYSVELTVYDYANNPSKARKIILYDRDTQVVISKEQLFVVKQASKESGYRWITDGPRNEGGRSRLSLSWSGRYSNPKQVQAGWLSRVEPWTSGIDDDYTSEGGGGNRTIHRIENSNGTAFYRLAFLVDKQGGFDLSTKNFTDAVNLTDNDDLPQSTWVSLSAVKLEKDIWMPALTSNDTVVIWMQAIDIVGHYVEEQILVRFDNTLPELDGTSPAILRQGTLDPYHSSIVIKASDLQSGIAVVRYYIMDASLRVNITSGNSAVTMLRRSTTGSSRTAAVCNPVSDTNCYCINGGECFLKEIVVVIDHCDIDKHYADDKIMEFHYVVVNQAGNNVKPIKPLVLKFDGGKPICRASNPFTLGTILAIVIGLLVLLILLVLVALMLVRWKQDKHPIPDRVRSFATSVRQKVTNTEKVHDSEGHVIYRAKTRRGRVTEDDDDIYVDGSDPGGWRVNRDQVEMGETLAQGRFAIVKKAYLKKGGEKKTVAAKFLPSGASEADKAMLKSKIAFHGNRVPPHDNIVRLIGVLDDGPVMLLEFCDLTLKDWLSSVGKVDSDALENMLNFTLQIASGMEHLHSKSIVHRRLAMRNVLLKNDGMNGLVAKLIGFGTFNDVGSDEDTPESNVAVPLKWLAPETLESVNRGKAVYSKMSDVWAYGITIWEIYSLGATPYPGKKSAEVEGLVRTGYRLPRPNDCPQELFDIAATPCWNSSPKKRPDFRTICRQIRDFRSGGSNQDGYYAVDPKSKHYDDPKERTQDYVSAKKTSSHPEELYEDTRR